MSCSLVSNLDGTAKVYSMHFILYSPAISDGPTGICGFECYRCISLAGRDYVARTLEKVDRCQGIV